MDRKKTGKLGEELAEAFLLKKGYEIIGKNYLKRSGEIDLIAWDKKEDELVFVEVKTRRNKAFGSPEEAVTLDKLAKMEKTAESWLEENRENSPWRIDIVAILIKEKPEFTHFKNVSL